MSASHALDFCAFESLEQMSNHIEAHARTGLLDFRDGKQSRLTINGSFHERGLRAAWSFDLTGALFKLSVAAPDDGEEMVEPREEFVFAVVPALGALLQDVVVIFLRLFNETFQTDVASDLVCLLVNGKQREQAGDAAIAVTEWMDAKEIENQCADGNANTHAKLSSNVTWYGKHGYHDDEAKNCQ